MRFSSASTEVAAPSIARRRSPSQVQRGVAFCRGTGHSRRPFGRSPSVGRSREVAVLPVVSREHALDRSDRPVSEPHVVIVGGGFGGLNAAKAFRNAPVRVTLVDRTNHHLFQPLLYQVATASLSPADIAVPIRSVLSRQRNVRVLLGEVKAVDLAGRRITVDADTMDYDYLILAVGAANNYFGHDEWARFAPALKNLDEALTIRERMLLA